VSGPTHISVEMVILLANNMLRLWASSPKDFVAQFETPYKPLLDAGVKFTRRSANHDNQTTRLYNPLTMKGERVAVFGAVKWVLRVAKSNVKFLRPDRDYPGFSEATLKCDRQRAETALDDWEARSTSINRSTERRTVTARRSIARHAEPAVR